jgi:hypothetical protein
MRAPRGASVRSAKGTALVQWPHQGLLSPLANGPTGQRFIFNPTRTVGQSRWKGNQANSWPVGPNAARHGKESNGVRSMHQGCALRWANCWAFGPIA